MASSLFTTIRRLFRPGIRLKLFLAIVAICAIMAVSMNVASRISFQNGFFDYLTEIEQERVNALAEELSEDYTQSGGWNALKEPRIWRRKILRFSRKTALQAAAEQSRVPPATTAQEDGRKRPRQRQQMPPISSLSSTEQARHMWESAHLRSSLGLFDRDKKTLIAGVHPGPGAKWTPIEANGDTVGWLSRPPLTGITDSADLRFHERQRTATMLITGLGILLAAATALIMAHYLIAPLRRFADTTRRLAGGDFTARVIQPEGFRLFPGISDFFKQLRQTGTERSKDNTPSLPYPSPVWQGDELQVLAKQLNHLAGVLEQNESTRRMFMAEIAHDLRTPLAVLKGEIEALEDGVRQVTPESLASLRGEVELLGRLVDDIHTLSLADVGRLHYDRSVIDLVQTLASTVHALKERMNERGIALDAVFPDRPVLVHADPARLSQILRNIMENSLCYTDSGGTVQVRCHTDQANAFVDVLDSPPAVPEEMLPRLFERFHTGDAARTRGKSGSGLGLAISRTLVEAQGGDIRALPSPLGGLWIRIQLPLAGQGREHA